MRVSIAAALLEAKPIRWNNGRCRNHWRVPARALLRILGNSSEIIPGQQALIHRQLSGCCQQALKTDHRYELFIVHFMNVSISTLLY